MPNLKELLIIDSLNVKDFASTYHEFFLALLPSVFILALLVEYITDLEPFSVLKRALVSIIILSSVGSFYYQGIDASIEAADGVLREQQRKNTFLNDLFYKQKMLFLFNQKNHFKMKDGLGSILDFLTKQMFSGLINTPIMVIICLIMFICFFILKITYSIVYFLGYAFIGIPCLLYLFSKMKGAMKGAATCYVWLLLTPHILVFILTLLSTEIEKGYHGRILGGSISGTALLLVLAIFIAFVPLITTMFITSAGVSSAGSIISGLMAHKVGSFITRRLSLRRIKNVWGGFKKTMGFGDTDNESTGKGKFHKKNQEKTSGKTKLGKEKSGKKEETNRKNTSSRQEGKQTSSSSKRKAAYEKAKRQKIGQEIESLKYMPKGPDILQETKIKNPQKTKKNVSRNKVQTDSLKNKSESKNKKTRIKGSKK